jgi:hypothetical protein
MQRIYTLALGKEERVGGRWHAQLRDTHGTTIATAEPEATFGLEGVLSQVVESPTLYEEEHGGLPPDGC